MDRPRASRTSLLQLAAFETHCEITRGDETHVNYN
jgi:hypothetical protein